MTAPLRRICLSLGSNIRPELALPQAVQKLHGLFLVERVSQVWESAAVGAAGPNFLNAALLLRAPYEPYALKEQVLRPLEAQLGRVRSADKNAPRTIDLDVILCDGQVIDAEIWERAHLAIPVLEVWDKPLRGPNGESLRQAAARLAGQTDIRPRADVKLC